MTWLVFGVSCLLTLAGAVSIISGAPIIQLERGWAEVISGTVALSGGGVVFALAGVLMRLEAIRDTLASQALPVAAEKVSHTPPAAIPSLSPPRPVPVEPVAAAPEPPRPAAAPGVEAEGRTEGLWKRVKRPDEPASPDALQQHGFPDRVLPDEAPAAPPTVDAPVVVPAHPVPVAGREPEPLPAANSIVAPPADAPDAGQIGWLERSLFTGPGARSEPAAPPREPPPVNALPDKDIDGQKEPLFGRTPPAAPEPGAGAEPEPTPDLAGEQHGGASVVGRYQAGSAAYVMYSDGTIEVETESGEMHRFGSMDELKAFIAQQDQQTVS